MNLSTIKSVKEKPLQDLIKTSNTLNELDLGEGAISNNDRQKTQTNIFKAVGQNRSVTSLNLSSNKINVNALASCISENTVLKKIDARFCRLYDDDVCIIADSLRHSLSIDTLDIYDNWLGDKAIIALASAIQANPVITDLNVGGMENDITSAGLIALVAATIQVPVLKKLDISWFGSSTSKGIEVGVKEGMMLLSEHLKDNKLLIALNIKHIKNDSETMKLLSQAIADNDTLTSLEINWKEDTESSSIFLNALKFNNTLQIINLSNNNLEDKDAASLAEIISVNTSLAKLDIACNKITEAGFKIIYEALKVRIQKSPLSICIYTNGEYGSHYKTATIEIEKFTQFMKHCKPCCVSLYKKWGTVYLNNTDT